MAALLALLRRRILLAVDDYLARHASSVSAGPATP